MIEESEAETKSCKHNESYLDFGSQLFCRKASGVSARMLAGASVSQASFFQILENQIKKGLTWIVMQEVSDALIKLQTVTLFRPIWSFQCSW